MTTINSVCTIDSVNGNNLVVEAIPNNLQNGSLQFYTLNSDRNLDYVSFNNFDQMLRESISRNKTFYITFCGISNRDNSVPEYLYFVFKGGDVRYSGNQGRGSVFLEFNLKKNGQSIENEICQLFTNNVGVFIQAYL